MKGTSMVHILVTHTLIVKIYFLPSRSNINPNIKHEKIKENSVRGSISSSRNMRFIDSIMNITKSQTQHTSNVIGVTFFFNSNLNRLGKHLLGAVFFFLVPLGVPSSSKLTSRIELKLESSREFVEAEAIFMRLCGTGALRCVGWS